MLPVTISYSWFVRNIRLSNFDILYMVSWNILRDSELANIKLKNNINDVFFKVAANIIIFRFFMTLLYLNLRKCIF